MLCCIAGTKKIGHAADIFLKITIHCLFYPINYLLFLVSYVNNAGMSQPALLAVGYRLDELPNDITRKTPASFEPTIDYVVVKIPRFAFEKFKDLPNTLGELKDELGTQMKSVGEVMAIGRTFKEALMKALRGLERDVRALAQVRTEDLEKKLYPNPDRIYAVIVGMGGAMLAFFLFILGAAVRGRKYPVLSGTESLIGASGVALTDLAPNGMVRVKSEEWLAEAQEGSIQQGVAVRVVAIEGLRLKVVKK